MEYGLSCVSLLENTLVHLGVNRSMISAAGVRPTWLVLIREVIQPQWTNVFPFGVTPFTSFRASSERSPVTLSAAKGLSRVAHEMLRCAQHDHSSGNRPPHVAYPDLPTLPALPEFVKECRAFPPGCVG